MAEQTLGIRIKIDSDTGKLTVLNKEFDSLGKSSAQASSQLSSLDGTMATINTRMVALVAAGYTAKNLFDMTVGSGIALNSQFEQMKLGIASLIAVNSSNTTAMGHSISTVQKFQMAQAQAAESVDLLRKANLQTPATLAQITEGYQAALGPSLRLGMSTKQTVEYVKLMTMAAAAMGQPMEQIAQESRALLSGEIDMNAQVARNLQITNEQIKMHTKQGDLYEFLTKKLGDFAAGGEAMSNSWEGISSNITDSIQTIQQKATEGIFDALKADGIDLQHKLSDNANEIADAFAHGFSNAYLVAAPAAENIYLAFEVSLSGINVLLNSFTDIFANSIDGMNNKYRELGFFDYLSLGFIVAVEGFRQLGDVGLSVITFLGSMMNKFQGITLDAFAGIAGGMGALTDLIGLDGSSFYESQAYWVKKSNAVKQDGLLIDQTQKAILGDMAEGANRLARSYNQLALVKDKPTRSGSNDSLTTKQKEEAAKTAAELKKAEAIAEAARKKEHSHLQAVLDGINKETKANDEALKKQWDDEDKFQTDKLKVNEDFVTAQNILNNKELDNNILALNKEYNSFLGFVEDKAILDEWYSSKKNKLVADDHKKAIDAYQSMSDEISKIDVGGTMSFSPTGDAGVDRFASMLTGMGQINDMYLKQAETEKQIALDRKKIDEDQKTSIQDKIKLHDELNKKENDLHKNSLKNEIASAAHTIALSKNVFKEKTAAYKAFNAIEKALNLASLALEAQKQIAILMTATTSTVASGVIVAGKTTEATASAVAGIANQAGGDPWTAFPRIAAMIGLMGSVLAMGGIAFGGSGSSATSVPAPDASMGTVLGGGAYAQSESITNITDLMDSIHTSEYSELRDINRAVTSMAQGIESAVTNIFRSGLTDTSGVQLSSSSSIFSKSDSLFSSDSTFGKIVGLGTGGLVAEKLFGEGFAGKWASILSGSTLLGALGLGGSSKQYIAGSGFNLSGGTIGDKANGNVGASTYVDVETAKKNFWGSASYSHNITTTALDDASSKSIALIYDSFQTTMEEINKGLGTDLGDSIAGYAVKAINISTAGLTGEEVVKKLNDTFSALGDTMASDVFGTTLEQYQKLGEGMLETAVRVITEKAVVLQDLGDVGITVNGDILSVSQSLVTLSGSLNNFQDSIASYYDKFFTDAEKQARSQDKFLGLFTDLNMTMPTTVEAFRSIVDSLDLTTFSGQETFTTLMASSSAFYDFSKSVEESTKTVTDSIISTVTTFVSAFDDLKKSTQSLIDSLSIPTNTSGKQDYLITQYQDLKKSFMGNFDSNGMADANSIEKMKSDYASLTSNISALSGAGINDMTKSALVTELGSFNSLFTKNEQAVKVEVVAGMLSVADQAKALGLTESQVTELQKSNGYSSTQIDKLYAISTTQATNEMLGSVNEWVKSLYDVQSQARALDTASLSSSSFAAGHVFGTQEKIDFAQKTGLTIGSESFNKAITDIQGFATKSDDVGYLAGLSGLNGSSVSNTSILSSIKSLGSLAPSDAQSALTGVSSLLNTSANSEYTANVAKHNAALYAYNEINGVVGRFNKIHKDWWQSTNEVADNATLQKYGSGGFNTNEKRGENANQAMYNSYVALADSYLAESNKYNIPLKTTFGFAVGTPNVPYDMTANIHQGEIIVPQNFSEGLRNGSLNMGSNKELIEEIRALRKEVVELKQINAGTLRESSKLNTTISRVTNGGNAMMTEVA